jgi:hypothetical protein
MRHLDDIEQRHRRDRWTDAFFIFAAAVLTAISIGSVGGLGARSAEPTWSVTVIESNLEIGPPAR